jgi:membrane associated rhomboid family serine protease
VIPIRDLARARNRPWVTWAIIAVNAAVFAFQYALGPDGEEAMIRAYGLVPAVLFSGQAPGSYVTPVTHMFLHGGILHVVGNMWFLHVFGDNVEDALGPWRFGFFYLGCGLAAAALQVVIDPGATVPMVGASGAIAGVLGAYLVLYPSARVLTLVPVMFFVEVPAFVFIVIWFGLQLAEALLHLGHQATAQGGVAFFAHVGGFLAGLAAIKPLTLLGGPRGGPPRLPPPPNRRVGSPFEPDEGEGPW